MRAFIILGITGAWAAGLASGQTLAGDWAGTLATGAAELRLVVHLTSTSGRWTGAMDSVDQGVNDIPLSDVILRGSRLTFSVPSVNGSYEGTLQPGENTIKGTWTQGRPFPLNLTRGVASSNKASNTAAASDIDGEWGGTLAGNLRLLVHVISTTGGLTAAIDSLDQGMKNLPATAVSRVGNTFTAE